MLTQFRTSWRLQECKQKWFSLALCALVSAGFGVFFAPLADDSYILLMRMAACRCVSIVGSAVAYFVPFLISFFLIVHSKPWLVYLICGIRIFSFTSVGWAIVASFGTAGWLVNLMMQFQDICLIPLMVWLSHRKLVDGCTSRALVVFIFTAIGIGMIYYGLISPFLANLIDSYETMGRYAIHVGLDWRL